MINKKAFFPICLCQTFVEDIKKYVCFESGEGNLLKKRQNSLLKKIIFLCIIFLIILEKGIWISVASTSQQAQRNVCRWLFFLKETTLCTPTLLHWLQQPKLFLIIMNSNEISNNKMGEYYAFHFRFGTQRII